MIVTDNDADRASFIKKIGDNVNLIFVMSGQECLEKIRNKEDFDLIIIKEKMDKLDALKTIAKLNAIKGFNTKVIIMTDNVEASKNLKMHGYDTILNNISSSELKKIIK